ncbi:MAG: MBL fold metallo-hydrolase [Clostridiales bacterium]|jgi:glyoxylase-like metal-dependent hydrolase (beta-lactamase superfamily II)|nr:MBL fold metallo-hydrolase [Clostridiales bacterium]
MQLAPNVYLLDAATNANVFLIKDGDCKILIDTGLPGMAGAILRELDTLGAGRLTAILLTHHDMDHTGNAYEIQRASGAAAYIGADDLPYVLHDKERPGSQWAYHHMLRPRPPARLRRLEKYDLPGGVQAIPTPGHTPGHHAFLYRRVLFCGDMLKSSPAAKPLRMPESAHQWPQRLKGSLLALLPYPFRLLCPSHGAPLPNDEELRRFIRREAGESVTMSAG